MPTPIDNLQVAAYTVAPNFGGAASLWRDLFGSDPTAFSPGAGHGQTIANGAAAGAELMLQVSLDRIDLFFTATPGQSPSWAVIPDLEPVLVEGLRLIKAVAAKHPINRAAVVVQNAKEAASPADAVKMVAAAVPGLPVPTQANDVTYQTTVRIASKTVPGGEINQLCRWQTVQRGFVQMSPNGVPTLLPSSRGANFYVDVGTVPQAALNPQHVEALYDELADFAKILVLDGYAALL